MGTIRLITTAIEYDLDVPDGETILEAFRRNNLPISGALLLDRNNDFVSVSHRPAAGELVMAYAMRNLDYAILEPHHRVVASTDPVTEVMSVRSFADPQHLDIVQYDRNEALGYIYSCFSRAVDDYIAVRKDDLPIQVALSPGGDGRVLAECLRKYMDEHPQLQVVVVIMASGFEDQDEHLSAGRVVAEKFNLEYRVVTARQGADLVGLRDDFNVVCERFRNEFPNDEPEVLATYWVQEVHFALARQGGRRCVMFGYNQEDVICDRLYQAVSGRQLPSFSPARSYEDFDVLAPLHQVPKRMLDAMDLENSLRNYRSRKPSINYLRSSLYFLSYLVAERFPAIAHSLAGRRIAASDPDEVLVWLRSQ